MMKKLEFISISSVRSRKRPFSYRSRINPVLIPYRSRIVPVSFSYRSPIVLASGSGNNTETIRKQYEVDICWKGGRYVVGRWRKRGGYLEEAWWRKPRPLPDLPTQHQGKPCHGDCQQGDADRLALASTAAHTSDGRPADRGRQPTPSARQ